MTDYVKNNQTGVIFEKVAEADEGKWIWIRDAGGIMHSAYASGFTAYTPTPEVGEIWTDEETGGPVVVVGEKDGQPVVIEVVGPDTGVDGVHVAYRRDPAKLRSPNVWPRRVKPTPTPDGPGPDVPDETPTPPVVADADAPYTRTPKPKGKP